MKTQASMERRRGLTVPWHLTRDFSPGALASLPACRNRRNLPASVPALPTGVRAFTIIECLVYAGLFALLLGLGTIAFYRCFDNMKGLRRNADDITRAVHAGELWRNDIRAAARAIQINEADLTIRIPQRDREVSYRFAGTQVSRKTGAEAPWLPLLSRVKVSQMTSDPRARVTAWRWELELQSLRKDRRLRPLFTFIAVPGAGNPP